MLLHTEAFTQSVYTQKLLHTDDFTHRHFYTQTLLHTEAFTHRPFYTQKRLHTKFYTQTLLHTNTLTHRDWTREMAILLQLLAIEPHFEQKGCAGHLANRNFTSVFGDQTSFRAKGLRRIREIAILLIYFSFWRSNLISCDSPPYNLEIAVFLQFLKIELHFVRQGSPDNLEIVLWLQFLAIELHFVWKGVAPGQLAANRNFSIQCLALEPHFVRKGCDRMREIAILLHTQKIRLGNFLPNIVNSVFPA